MSATDMSIGDRLKWLRLISQLDLGVVKEILDLFEGFENKDLRSKVETVLLAIEKGVTLTPTTRDDQIVDTVQSILNTPLMDTLVQLVERYLLSGDVQINDLSITTEAEMIGQFQAQGVPWGKIIELLPVILELIRQFQGDDLVSEVRTP